LDDPEQPIDDHGDDEDVDDAAGVAQPREEPTDVGHGTTDALRYVITAPRSLAPEGGLRPLKLERIEAATTPAHE
jgi:hypothetical protein